MSEARIYLQSEKQGYVQVPSPLAYTMDINQACCTVLDMSKTLDDLVDEADNEYVLKTFKTSVANDPHPEQCWTTYLYIDGNPYYRIDIIDCNKIAASWATSATRTMAGDALAEGIRDLIYDRMLDIFGSNMLRNTVQAAMNAIKNNLGGGSGATFTQTDDIDQLIAEIQEKTKAEIVKPKENMGDYVCDDTLKEQLLQIVDFFDNRQTYVDAGIEIPKGILFKGPPGTGKTYAARCIAGTVDCYFMTCTASSLQGMYIGSGAANIKAVFKGARMLAEKSNKGVIIFMDELDSVSSRGSSSGASDEVNRTINQLLAEMSGFQDDDNVMVMGATNYSELIDPALLRSGRFSRQITIDYPDDVQREQMLTHYVKKLTLPIGWDISDATALTKTFTPADIKEVVNNAAIKCIRQKKTKMELDDLNEAINEVITKDIRKPDKPKLLDLVTAHECGHVLVEVILKGTVPTKVTNYAYGDAGGFTQPSEILTGIVKREDLINEIKMLLGGRAAEEVCLGYITTGASNDLEKAKGILKAYYTKYNFETYTAKELDQLLIDKLNELYLETVEHLNNRKKYLDELIDELRSKRVLYSSDIAVTLAPLLMNKGGNI